MSDRDQVESRIREILATETKALPLSHALFRRGGLFSQLAGTREQRELLVQTPLFQEAQRKLSELQEKEMAEFRASLRKGGDAPGMFCSFDMKQLQAG
jgi:hypothetical protein